MLTRAARWFLVVAPMLAGALLLIFGTAGSTSVAFGITLIGIAPIIWMWNWFIRMSFDDDARERETQAREQRAREQQARDQRARDARSRPERSERSKRASPPVHSSRRPSRPRRRPL